jgi:GNAT superfamily N-acetyltransferase
MAGLSIRVDDQTRTERALKLARACLAQHTESANGISADGKPFSVLAFMDQRIIGGLMGKVFWNWLYADLVWVEKDFRGRGIGGDVMNAAEQHARGMKLTGIYLWTETWQAPVFYQKLGYTQFVEFKDFPPGYSRFGFRKYLA